MSTSISFERLPSGDSGLAGARPGPDLAAHDYVEEEYVVRGVAVSYRADDLPIDGRWNLEPADTAPFTTRVVVRRPAGTSSGVLVAEWLNVSSGRDAAPGWTYQAEEIIRRGHIWVGVSAQYGGVEGGLSSVSVADLASPGLKGDPSGRYAELTHPGDAFCFDIFASIGACLGELETLRGQVEVVLAMGQSQAAFCLTSFINGVQPLQRVFDGFLVHSRGGAAAPLGKPDAGLRMDEVVIGQPTGLRTDLGVPVLVVETETDLFGRIGYLPARQPDHDLLRVWEVAGAAHADKYLIDEFEDFLDCPGPVNRGQQSYVLKAALRHLETWARCGEAPPSCEPLVTNDSAFVLDDFGNVRGGVRTPAVAAPVEVLSGHSAPEASLLCRLFGSTTPADPELIARRYRSPQDYLAAYEAAYDACVEAGVVLAEDRDQLLAEARPDLVD